MADSCCSSLFKASNSEENTRKITEHLLTRDHSFIAMWGARTPAGKLFCQVLCGCLMGPRVPLFFPVPWSSHPRQVRGVAWSTSNGREVGSEKLSLKNVTGMWLLGQQCLLCVLSQPAWGCCSVQKHCPGECLPSPFRRLALRRERSLFQRRWGCGDGLWKVCGTQQRRERTGC